MHTEFGRTLPCRGAGCFQCSYERKTNEYAASAEARRAITTEFIVPTLRTICLLAGFNADWINNPPDTLPHTLGRDVFLCACMLLKQEQTGETQAISQFAAVTQFPFLKAFTFCNFTKLARLTNELAYMMHILTETMHPALFAHIAYMSRNDTPLIAIKHHLAYPEASIVRINLFILAGDEESVLKVIQGLRGDINQHTAHAATLKTLDTLEATMFERTIAISMALHKRLGAKSLAGCLSSELVRLIAQPDRLVTPFHVLARYQ